MPTVMPAPLLHAQSALKGKLANAHCLSTSGSVGSGAVVVVVVVRRGVERLAVGRRLDGDDVEALRGRQRDVDGLVERRVDARRAAVVVDGDDGHRVLAGLRRLLHRVVGRCGDLRTPRERRSARRGRGRRRRGRGRGLGRGAGTVQAGRSGRVVVETGGGGGGGGGAQAATVSAPAIAATATNRLDVLDLLSARDRAAR